MSEERKASKRRGVTSRPTVQRTPYGMTVILRRLANDKRAGLSQADKDALLYAAECIEELLLHCIVSQGWDGDAAAWKADTGRR